MRILKRRLSDAVFKASFKIKSATCWPWLDRGASDSPQTPVNGGPTTGL